MGKKRDKKKTPRLERARAVRRYAGAKSDRLMTAAGSSSADSELYVSLKILRNNARRLVRDNVYALRAKRVMVNNVIGQGVGLQAKVTQARGRALHKTINAGIERAWATWCRAENCHTGGALHFSDFERTAFGEVYEAGEAFVRLHATRFGDSSVPLALELIESERVADDYEIQSPSGARVDLGIERDAFGRAVAYYFHSRHPNDLRRTFYDRDDIVRVPADEVIHLRQVERWPQARGVPMMHAAITRAHQLGEFEDAALVAARIGAAKVGFFQASEWAKEALTTEQEADGTASTTVEPGEFTELPYGYTFQGWDPQYPHENFDPFVRASLRGFAAGTGPSYESISRDYSQSNYSSSRLAALDDRDLYRVLQAWWIRSFRDVLHRRWLLLAVSAGAIGEIEPGVYYRDRERFEQARFKARGWGWVDPTKEVAAYKEAELAGYKTKGDIIAETAGGIDIEDFVEARRLELDMLIDSGITTDTTPDANRAPVTPPNSDDEPIEPSDASEDQQPTNDDTTPRGLRAVGGE